MNSQTAFGAMFNTADTTVEEEQTAEEELDTIALDHLEELQT
jgi:hypothetical protein